MQDTLLSAFKHIGGFQGRSKFSTWLVSIARNAALQRLRGGKNTKVWTKIKPRKTGIFVPAR